ncbi:MAG: antitoxin [Lachnospiraceae bacterium]|nr:antitoxin [Lachnospiraceae bacterium]
MRKIDEIGLKLCKMQAEVFSASVKETNCSSLIFMRRFMNSGVAQRMDLGGFLFEACDLNQIIQEIETEFGESSYGKEKYFESELYWIGYVYRYWSYTYQKTSKQVYKIIKPKELRSLYYPYHSLDPAQAIERILEAKDLNEKDFTAQGVKIMRDIMRDEKHC